ncbi:MAG: SRPBCC family protein [Anaerolineales bacterium]|nr:SRPBCC family protein [Anaerolineales bacterium]
MKFALELPLQKSRDEVWKAFDNPENTKIWQPSLINFETVSGTQGQTGAVSKLTYKEGKREFSLIEKVTHRAEPDRFDIIYENEFADNSVKNTFVIVNDNETLWRSEVEFKFKTLIMKLIGPSMKTNYILRTERDMQRFKDFVEKP